MGKDFIEKCLSFNNFPLDILVETYLYSNDIEQSFDYENKILKKILERDPNIIIKILKFNSSERISYHNLEHEHYDFIWDIDNCNTIINSIFEYFIESDTYYYSDHAISAFFPDTIDKYGTKPIKYLESIIDEKYLDDRYMEVVFSLICYKYPSLK